MSRAYLHYDVFTGEPLTGNQLAVFLDGRGLEPARMQSLAREMGFSESTFILPPETPDTDVRMRIFTPVEELPMAGHPTIGSAFALAETGAIEPGRTLVTFGLGVGPTPVALEWRDGRLRFAWMTQKTPDFGTIVSDIQAVAAGIGVRRDDIAGELPIQEVSCGVPYLVVPMTSRAAVDRAVGEASPLQRLAEAIGVNLPVYLFTTGPGVPEATVYSRMFAPGFGVVEDPATGSASGPLGCYLVRYGLSAGDAAQRILNLQGQAMGRPSRIHIRITGTRDRIVKVEVGGEAVLVARGTLVV
ncbi:MAG: PhzF family phenazine biosynthesis protein [Vicinamibacterales bacterium]